MAACVSFVLWWRGPDLPRKLSHMAGRPLSVRGRSVPLGWSGARLVVACLFLVGVAMQVRIGLANLRVVPESDPDIEAAEWIKGNTAPSSVVLARKEDLVYHYSQRRVIWLPPSSNARMLMDGIRRYHVEEIVVVDRENSYWKPSDEECFRALVRAYPTTFQLVHQGWHSKVFVVHPGVGGYNGPEGSRPTTS